MILKLKVIGLASLVIAGGAALAVSMAGAQTTGLAVTCSGSVSSNVITWTATPANGVAPYAYVWSGTNVSGTATSAAATYTANGTYTANIQVTDASSTVATSTCAQTVTAVGTPSITASLNNALGSQAVATGTVNQRIGSYLLTAGAGQAVNLSQLSVRPNGGIFQNLKAMVNGVQFGTTQGVISSGAVYAFAGTPFNVPANGTVTVDVYADILSSAAGSFAPATTLTNCAATSVLSFTALSCNSVNGQNLTVNGTTPAPTPTSTAPHPFIMKPTLAIGENGQFLARGMKVTSVASGSFQAQVWGITYTVNWSGNLVGTGPFEFWFRYNKANSTSTPAEQLAVGDEVGVAGKISSASPLVVNATVVRDYDITAPRPIGKWMNGKMDDDRKENDKKNGGDAQIRMNGLLEQLKKLQDLFKSRGSH